MITESLFVIAVPDLERSAAFYRDVLGFTVTKLGDSGWRMFVRDNCKIMAGECPDAIPPRDLGDHSYFAYLVVDDVDTYYRRVQMSPTEVVNATAISLSFNLWRWIRIEDTGQSVFAVVWTLTT